MTFTKLALAVLGTIGLTAGTVLAVAEPAPAPLPAAVAQISKGKCPGSACATGSACSKAPCDPAHCTTVKCDSTPCPKTVAVSVKATDCKACPAPAQQAEPACVETAKANTIACDKECTSNVAACDRECTSKANVAVCEKECTSKVAACEDKCTERVTAGTGVNSNSGVVGHVVFNASADQCQGDTCSVKVTKCNAQDSTCTITVQATTCDQACGSDACPTAACASHACAAETCHAEACSAASCETGTCPANTPKKHTRRLTLGFGFSSSGPILHVAAGPQDDSSACDLSTKTCCPTAAFATQIAASLFGSCAKSACSAQACDASQPVAAIGCTAKPACVTDTCPVSACGTTACGTSACAASACTTSACAESKCAGDACETNAACEGNSCPASSAACDACENCTCTDCECGPCDESESPAAASTRDPQAQETTVFINGNRFLIPSNALSAQERQHVVDRLQALRSSNWLSPETLGGFGAGFLTSLEESIPAHSNESVPPVIHGGAPLRSYDSYRLTESHPAEAPGRVRVTHVTPHVYHVPHDIHLFPAADFRPSQRIRLSSFAAPVAASQPPAPPQIARSISPRLEGTWTRTAGSSTCTFTHRNGRLYGSWRPHDQFELRFSGSCSVTKDDQFVGVIDEIEASGEHDESFGAHAMAQRLIDQPFAARFIVDGDSLILKDVRCSGLSPTIQDEKQTSELLQYVRTYACGKFERGEE